MYYTRFIFLFAFLLLFVCNANVYANPNDTGSPGGKTDDKGGKVAAVVCNIVTTLNGPISQAIATLVIIITGYSFFVGKVSIGMLFVVAAGIMMVFGAQQIMGWILGGSFDCSTYAGKVIDDKKTT